MKKVWFILLLVIVIAFGVILFAKHGDDSSVNNPSSNQLIPAAKITHGHGMAVDVADPNKLYIATHHGIYVLVNDKDLYQVGNNNNDFMGFSPDAKNPKTFYASGHPVNGGNIGFQKSDDGGFTWNVVSEGIDGPVDFHAMSVSPVNPDLVYGWYKGKLQRSLDNGKNWLTFNNGFPIIGLTADPKDENIVYALSPQVGGIMVSKDKGEKWQVLSKDLESSSVSALGVDPKDSKFMLSYSEKLGLAISTDGGISWQQINQSFDGNVLYFAFDNHDSKKVYALTHTNALYKSLNGGETWNKIR
ncbi:MAG TPA: hypothetical protein VEA59_06300 [Patescibacteria group bacterium]|nr:hypothetical protein [Patescibacteria group bacterium]